MTSRHSKHSDIFSTNRVLLLFLEWIRRVNSTDSNYLTYRVSHLVSFHLVLVWYPFSVFRYPLWISDSMSYGNQCRRERLHPNSTYAAHARLFSRTFFHYFLLLHFMPCSCFNISNSTYCLPYPVLLLVAWLPKIWRFLKEFLSGHKVMKNTIPNANLHFFLPRKVNEVTVEILKANYIGM